MDSKSETPPTVEQLTPLFGFNPHPVTPPAFLTVLSDKKTATVNWKVVEQIANDVQRRPVEIPIQINEAVALVLWLSKNGGLTDDTPN